MKCPGGIGIMKFRCWMRYFLGLGSNVGDRRAHLELAIRTLKAEGVFIKQRSSLYETEPVDLPPSASRSWFFNLVIEADADLKPVAFLRVIKNIEKKMGRETSSSRRARAIDIDILLADDCVVQTEELVIPHPRLEKRNFVLIPLQEIAPETHHPILMKTIKELAETCPDRSAVKKIEG